MSFLVVLNFHMKRNGTPGPKIRASERVAGIHSRADTTGDEIASSNATGLQTKQNRVGTQLAEFFVPAFVAGFVSMAQDGDLNFFVGLCGAGQRDPDVFDNFRYLLAFAWGEFGGAAFSLTTSSDTRRESSYLLMPPTNPACL